ncbi:hypothetical protein [Ketobacter sp.]|uniref:hypothetical protein n=1 Tax=Ketobacter sp. TaxID=2083498 RepID=UPI000F1CED05|nr:hypothetical protein [Ketobacter sp.]RLT96894.1 MAG: hypothetical protein D9N14_12770 [Ketobacter sp.]
MLLQQYKDKGLFFNQNFLEETSDAGVWGYRGDLILVEGEKDDKGHAMPPELVMRGAVLVAGETITLLVGGLDSVADIPTLVDKYGSDFAPGLKGILFIVDLKDPMKIELGGADLTLIPLVQGVPWNEAMEELALEKGDFKGQSPADKLVTLAAELASYKPKYPAASLDDALACTTDAKREVWGAV